MENVIYLIMLLALVGGVWFTKGQFLKNTNHLVTWALIILGLVMVYNLYERVISTPREVNGLVSMQIPYSNREGGYAVGFEINSIPTRGVFDTGATEIVLTYETAKASNINMMALDFNVPVNTANGETMNARTLVDQLSFGDQIYSNIDVLIAPQGELQINLLGTSLMNNFQSTRIQDNKMMITF